LDPDDAAPTQFDNDGAVFWDSPGITLPGTVANTEKLMAVDTIGEIHRLDSVLIGSPIFGSI
jgi:hypothetical protein